MKARSNTSRRIGFGPSFATALVAILLSACGPDGSAEIQPLDSNNQSFVLNGLPPLPLDLPGPRNTQAIDVTFQMGQDAIITTPGATPQGATELQIAAGTGALEYAIYEFNPGAGTLVGVLAAIAIDAGDQVWIAIANYGTMKWQLQGPYPAAGAAQFDNLGSGDYTSAAGNCYFAVLAYNSTTVDVATIEFSVDNAPPTFSIIGQVSDSAGPGLLVGVTLTLTPGGAMTLTSINGDYQFSGLAAGTYTVTPSLTGYTFEPPSTEVTLGPSATGVDFVGTAEVQPVTYTIDIAPLMENYCTGCHDANSPSADIPLTTYQEVSAAANAVLSVITDDSMPPGGNKLTAQEKQLFQDWIDGGKLE